jgi:pimeloyl-ACP methyl ester carboxylesterase
MDGTVSTGISLQNIGFVPGHSIDGKIAIVSHGGQSRSSARKHPILFFHGATVPTQFTSEYKIDGVSWMDWNAKEGWASFGFDLPGYGRSDGYPPSTGAVDPRKYGSSETLMTDIDNCVNHVLKECGCDQLHVVAISRGAIPAGYYASKFPGKIRSLTFHAPITHKNGVDPAIIEELLGSPEVPKVANFGLSAMDRFHLLESDRPDGTTTNLEPSFITEWPRNYGAALAGSSSPELSVEDRKIDTPIGFAVDIFDAWHGEYFDPAAITMPVLIVRGDWDRFLTPATETQELFERIASAEKYYLQMPRSTHSILFERSRYRMYRAVSDFQANFD